MSQAPPSTAGHGLAGLSLVELLEHAQRADVELWAEGERLRFSAPKGGLPPELRDELVRRKADLLTFLQRATGGADGAAIEPRAEGGDPPLSYAQERLWFFDQVEPGSAAYNLFQAVRLGGPLVVAALARCLDLIRRRHEVLRTVFPPGAAGRPVQRIEPPLPRPLPVADL
ncbi:MAG: non-ribosomal peptide synthetase, partial [Acidobacteria bacterium]|nr:non-ribosomal peptide synthetase [Acidobacteriota bacterium]